MKAQYKVMVFAVFLFLVGSSCSAPDETKIVLSFSDELLERADLLISITGMKDASKEELFAIKLRFLQANLMDEGGSFRAFAKSHGLEMGEVRVKIDAVKLEIMISGEIDQKYSNHFLNLFTAFANERRIAAIKEQAKELEDASPEIQRAIREKYPNRLSRMAFNWSEHTKCVVTN